jgi:hypothetical protein
MTNRSNLYSLLLLFLFSCSLQDHPPQSGGEEPVVDKNAFLASLTAPDRYWRIEQLHIKVGDSTRNINFFPFTDAVEYVIATSVVPFISFQFDSSIVDEINGQGPFGNVPYPTESHMELSSLGNTYPGSWQWNDNHHTVELKLPSAMSSVIRSASRSKNFFPSTGYLDNKVAPRFITLSQAQSGMQPERISVIVEEDDAILGKVYYTLTLRASWIIAKDGGTAKVPIYKVLY